MSLLCKKRSSALVVEKNRWEEKSYVACPTEMDNLDEGSKDIVIDVRESILSTHLVEEVE